MTFDEILVQVIALLQREKRVSYRALQRHFNLDAAYLDDLKVEIIEAKQLAMDENDRILVWVGDAVSMPESPPAIAEPIPQFPVQPGYATQIDSPPRAPHSPEAERRQLTVMFCDLVDSTSLAGRLDPEDLREVIRAYQATCAAVIHRFDGYIAQYLGDGLLIYFGFPQAHEDNAQWAIRAGLGMIEAMETLNAGLERDKDIRLAVRIGIHTGPVVVGEIGGSGRYEQLALGATPNVAARVQGLAAPNTVVISTATYRLVEGFFAHENRGAHALKGVLTPVQVYRVLRESGAQSRLEVAAIRGLTPLVGRESEVTQLLERWQQVKHGMGQVVLLSGEAGIGKSRLVQVIKDHLAGESHTRLECRGMPYYQNTALYPMIDLFQQVLQWQPDDLLEEKLYKLETTLAQYSLALDEAVPLFAGLVSLALPANRYAPLTITPQRQRQKVLEALQAMLLKQAAQRPVLFIMEDLHWVDASTLELLKSLIDQASTARILTLLTFRPVFQPLWDSRPHVTSIILDRLSLAKAESMVQQSAGGKALPAEVLQQILAKTDGVPLFVEELTKTILESELLTEVNGHYELTGSLSSLAIPATLQDSLMARLDRLGTAKTVAQLGSTLGREFSYALLQAVSPQHTTTLRSALERLVGTGLLYQQGTGSQVRYSFKHALIQEAAYESLLKRTRQQYHERIAQVLVEQFSEITETQPELLAHHYTEAGMIGPAIRHWGLAGQHAIERSANVEAIAHLTRGLELLRSLPETPERIQQELTLQIALGAPFVMTKGYAAPEVEHVYTRARELGRQVGETPQLFPILWGLWMFYLVRAEFRTGHALGEQLLRLAQGAHDTALLIEAHLVLGITLFHLGDVAAARTHLEQGSALYDPQQHSSLAFLYWQDPGAGCLLYVAHALWLLGYPEQSLQKNAAALTLTEQLSHPHSQVLALTFSALLHNFRRESQLTQERADAALALATEQGFMLWVALATIVRGWALTEQGQSERGITQMHQGLAAYVAMGTELARPHRLALLAESYGNDGQAEAGLRVLAEALALIEKTGERYWEAELYRLKGKLLLQSGVQSLASGVLNPQAAEAATCFQHALSIARQQQAKSLELRAALSLSRLWQQQGKPTEAYELLAPIYTWFTEGFDTADLQEAKALLEALARWGQLPAA